MKKQIIAFVFVILAVGLLFSGCEGTPQGETEQIFQEWNTDIPFKLLAGSSTEVDVTVKSSIDTDQETVRKSASAYIDPDEAEAVFEGSEIRWVKCVADVSLPEDSEYSVLDFAFMCFWGQYPDIIFGSEYYSANQSKCATSSNLVIEYQQSKDFRSCQAIIYACIPVEDDSYMIEIFRNVGGSHNTTVPKLPDDSVLCWKISDAIME